MSARIDDHTPLFRRSWSIYMIEETCEHVAAHDQPASLSELSALAAAAGLTAVSLLAKYRQHHLIRFAR